MNTELVLLNAGVPPRALILGFSDDPTLEARVRGLVGDVRVIEDLADVDEDEWDLLITDRPWSRAGPFDRTVVPAREGLCVLYRSLADGDLPRTLEDRDGWRSGIMQAAPDVGDELHLPATLPAHLVEVIRQHLVPVASARRQHPRFAPQRYWGSSGSMSAAEQSRVAPPPIEPFLQTRGGACLAGRFRRSETSEAWMLPEDVPDVVPWLKAALREWHALNPARFLGLPDWSDAPAWATLEERRAAEQAAQVSAEQARLLDEYDAKLAQLRADLDAARARASDGPRRLLTADGEELVEAVQQCLVELGFDVVDRDQARPGEKLEDLHVTDRDERDWIALAEVKGFGKGAKTTGITQFLRFVPRFTAEAGRAPSALWYVVNHHRLKDPMERGQTLAGADEDVTLFADAGGVVIDTVDLFRLLQQVQAGDLGADEARAGLRGASGRFSL